MATSALLKGLSDLWSYYWFRPAPLVDLAFCRIIMAAGQGVFLVWWDYLWLLHERAARPDSLYNPLIALRLLLLPIGAYRPSVAVIDAVYWVTIAASVTAAVGLCSRLSLALLALGSMFIHAYIYSLGDLHHPEALMMIALTLLALGPSGRALSIDALIAGFRATDDAAALRGAQGHSAMARWPVLAMRWVVALVYLSAAIHKLSLGGLDWMNGYTLQYYLLYHGLERGNDVAVWLSRNHELVWLMSWSTIIFEGTFFLVLVWPTLAWLYLPVGIGLHVGIAATSIADPFLIYLPVYAAFVPWHTMWRETRTSIAGGQFHSQRGRHQEADGGDEHRELERGSLYNKGTVRHRLAERFSFWLASVMILSILLLQASATYRPLCMGTVSLTSPHF
jgi:hypothetical protein